MNADDILGAFVSGDVIVTGAIGLASALVAFAGGRYALPKIRAEAQLTQVTALINALDSLQAENTRLIGRLHAAETRVAEHEQRIRHLEQRLRQANLPWNGNE